MARTATTDNVIVEEVVAALTGSPQGERGDLRAQMERAAREFDAHTADAFCKALLAHLGEDPTAVRELEALIILGLAHPGLLDRQRIPLVQEARRLAVLLEKKGEAERAQTLLELLSLNAPGDRAVERDLGGIMRRTGSLDRLVERHLRRAEEAMQSGRRDEAVRWLREVLLLDRSRRDVARMIRDLRYEDSERRHRWMRRLRATVALLVLAGATAGVVWREMRVRADYSALSSATDGGADALREQLARLDAWVEENPLWHGMFAARHERARLRGEIDKLDAAVHAAERQRVAAETRADVAADAERALGRRAAEQNDFVQARVHFERALKMAPPDWGARLQVETDIDAITAWLQRNQVSARQVEQR